MSTTAPFVRAIETKYKGYRFRSRLEARWAVFFDQMEYTWRYEDEGFELPSGRYLPDFRIETSRTEKPLFVEIKGQEPSEVEKLKCFELAVYSGCDVLLLSGDIGAKTDESWSWFEFTFEPTIYTGYRTIRGSEHRGDIHFAIRLPAFLAERGFESRLPPAFWLDGDRASEYVKKVIDLDREYQVSKYEKETMWHFGVSDTAFFTVPRNCYVEQFYHFPSLREHGRTLDALEYARSARFEFGETPR